MSGDCSASLPNYPKKLFSPTGQFLEDAVIICGGGQRIGGGPPPTNECYSLAKKATSFESITPMKEARQYAKSIVIQSQIWVTGGDSGGITLSSTEYIPKSSNNEPSLPELFPGYAIYCYALVSINETISMVIGGLANRTYYFNHQSQTWKDGPTLIIPRLFHTAGLIMDHVTHTQHIAVVGGIFLDELLDSVELLLNGNTQFTKGI